MTTDPIETLDAGAFDHAPQVSRELRPCTSYTLRVNGFERPVTDAWIGESLLYVLRERLGLAGAKDGCEQGECGACSVQVDGQLVAGCLVPAALAQDSEINTVEGLSAGGGASDVQQALAESGAVQCGYCTPGMAMAVHDLLQRNHRPTEVEARQALCGNLCRCTGYRGVLAAVQSVADARALEAEEAEEALAAETADAAAADAAAAGAAAAAAAAAEEPEQPADPPVYTDEDAWIEHVPQPPVEQPAAAEQPYTEQPFAEQVPVEQPVVEQSFAEQPYAGQPYAEQPFAGHQPVEEIPTTAGTGVGVGMQYGTPDGQGGYDTGVYDTGTFPAGAFDTGTFPAGAFDTGVLPQVQGVPAQAADGQGYYPQAGYPEQQQYPATPPHGTYPPGGYPDGGYSQQTGYDAAGGYDGPVYEQAPATGFDGTPAHGTPYVPTPPHGVPAEGTAPAGVPYGATPAHGIRLPEDDHAS
ncbi:2Fe-2S iron-sulfur cluster-binding protein [Kitasatospora sp. NPDC127111]|uniref:(2Fe-2S)-binding protein n=1 Tax=Kitasatospora sp. NPDC127111 TaxID=3345363 RepID=UPI003645B87C